MTSGSSKKTLTKCQQTPAPPGLLNLHNCELGLTSLLNKFTGHKHFVIAIEGAQYGSFFHYKITHNSNVAFLEKKTNSQKKKKQQSKEFKYLCAFCVGRKEAEGVFLGIPPCL